jgi:hypothetical protein
MSRNPSQTLALGLLAVSVIAGASWLVSGSSRGREQRAGLRVEVARPKATPEARHAADVAAASPHDTTTASVTRTQRSPEETQRYYDAVHDAQKELLRRSFDEQAVDVTWSTQARAQLTELYRGPDLRALTTRVECRTSLCRVDFTYADAEEGPKAVHHLIGHRPWPGRGYSSYDTAKKAGFYYLAREGHEMPRVNPKEVAL